MKPFNLSAALAGAPVVTRTGSVVTQLFYMHEAVAETYQLVGVVNGVRFTWTVEGKHSSEPESVLDLFMKSVKRTGWVNVYPLTRSISNTVVSNVYTTKEEADNAAVHSDRLDCVQITWEG